MTYAPSVQLKQLLFNLLFLAIMVPPVAQAQSSCRNPNFPGCLARSPQKPLKIAIMIDESGSVTDAQQALIREATIAYATELAEKINERNQVKLGVYSFANLVRTVMASTDVKSSSFKSRLTPIKNLNFRGGATRFSSALQSLQSRNPADIVYFITDGKIPERENIRTAACNLKRRGTFLFAVILGNTVADLPIDRISELTGPRQIKGDASLIEQADWMLESFNVLNECMVELASVAIDQIHPVIKCPARRKVTTSMDPSRTGKATATDNCDSQLDITYEDAVGEGNCNWNCQINRTWTATDQRGNSSSCVQILEKSATKPLEQALEEEPLVLGFNSTTLTIEKKDARCLAKWMPYQGTRISGLKRGNQKVSTSCRPGTNAINSSGKITNPLLGEALQLAIYLKIEPEFGKRSLSSLSLTIPTIIKQNLVRNPDVNDLMETTNKTLGNLILVPHKRELLKVLKAINQNINTD